MDTREGKVMATKTQVAKPYRKRQVRRHKAKHLRHKKNMNKNSGMWGAK